VTRAPQRAARLPEGDAESLTIVAYHEAGRADLPIVPATRTRDFIELDARHGRHCLPLMMANQNGWFVLNNQPFEATWDGENAAEGLHVRYDSGEDPRFRAHSAFGHGIISFMIPYLIRTPAGVNLLARGPANMPKDGIAPLEGLVETDWSVATFTMNWKFTRPGVSVRFERDEPVCMLVPHRRGELEAYQPELRTFDSNPELRAGNAAFNNRRHENLVKTFVAQQVEGAGPPGFEGDYMRGVTPTGERAPEHQRKLQLKSFEPAGD
jgi:hypothetical protein